MLLTIAKSFSINVSKKPKKQKNKPKQPPQKSQRSKMMSIAASKTCVTIPESHWYVFSRFVNTEKSVI